MKRASMLSLGLISLLACQQGEAQAPDKPCPSRPDAIFSAGL